MVCVDEEERKAMEIEVALLNSPDDCKTFQLNGQIALLIKRELAP